jgi:hypothetical protein
MRESSVMPSDNMPSRSYILRLWREASATNPAWRASLTLIPDGPRHGFAGLVEAMRYLQSELAAADQQLDDNSILPPQMPND